MGLIPRQLPWRLCGDRKPPSQSQAEHRSATGPMGGISERRTGVEWQEKTVMRVCNIIMLQDLGSTDITWSMVMLSGSLGMSYVAMISDSPCGWGCISCMWAVSPLRVKICFSMWLFLYPVWCREKQRTCCFCIIAARLLKFMTKALSSGYKQLEIVLLGSNLRDTVTYKVSKCRGLVGDRQHWW